MNEWYWDCKKMVWTNGEEIEPTELFNPDGCEIVPDYVYDADGGEDESEVNKMFYEFEFDENEIKVMESAINAYNEDISLIDAINANECYLTECQIDELINAMEYLVEVLRESRTRENLYKVRLMKSLYEELEYAC